MSSFDLIVVGAGPFGLIAGQTWLEINPEHHVLLLEAGPDLGGVWAKSRIYPTMTTQSPLGMFEYSCYPMPMLPKNETFYGNFSGAHVGEYLEAFAQHKKFAGQTLKERIFFNSPVSSIIRVQGGWSVEAVGKSYACKKLIVATGVTSVPSSLNVSTNDFRPPVVHSRYLAANVALLSAPEIKHVVVIGGSKSSFDAVQLLRSLKKEVSWIIRTDGQGPALLSTPDAPWPLTSSHEIISTRLVAKMSPCIFEPVDGWTKFYHGNRFGIWLVDTVYSGVDKMWRGAAKYDRDENMRQLTPSRPVFWSSDGVAVLNSPSLWDDAARTHIFRDGVAQFKGNEIVLKSGEVVTCDAVISAIGWSNCYPFIHVSLARTLGLPLLPADAEDHEISAWEARIESATEKVVATFPRLANVPAYPDHAPKSTPSRLYRGMIPVEGDDEHSIVFVGTVGTTQSLNVAEVQALWATAYLSNKISLPNTEEMKNDVALATAWRRRRYLGDGYTFIYDQIPYTCMLLRDLGLNDQRKGGGWKEILSPYVSKDYTGIVNEWMKAYDDA